MGECNHQCGSCSSTCSSQGPESFRESPHPLSNIKKVIGVVSGKGGVGKSLVTALLAVTANRAGLSTAVLDADITGPSIPRVFGLKEKADGGQGGIYPVSSKTGIQVMSVNLLLENETDPVVWRGPVIAGVVTQFWRDVIWGDVDFLFVDMPPGTGDVPLTVFQSLPLDGVIIVATPQELVSMIVEKAVKMAEMLNVPVLGLVENMSWFQCTGCGEKLEVFGPSHVEETAKRLGIEKTARIPIDPKLAAACDKGMIELFDGDWLDDFFAHIENVTK